MANDTHRWTGNHAQEVSVGDKRVMLAPGDFVTLSKDDAANPDNAELVESGLLMTLSNVKSDGKGE